jgi:hypothetical protein
VFHGGCQKFEKIVDNDDHKKTRSRLSIVFTAVRTIVTKAQDRFYAMVFFCLTVIRTTIILSAAALVHLDGCHGFVAQVSSYTTRGSRTTSDTSGLFSHHDNNNDSGAVRLERRDLLQRGLSAGVAAALVIPAVLTTANTAATAADNTMDQTKFVQQYEDFVVTPEGWSYRDVTTPGKGEKAQLGDRVVFEWSGYTIGYFGRPFQAKGGPQGVSVEFSRVE